jgi:hypothetical protein
MKWYAGQNLPRTHARPTFSEAWFYRCHGMTFGEKYHHDPVFRTCQDREAMKLLHERFGQAGIGEKDPKPRPHLEICGHRLIPALFGCEIFFQNDQAPSCRHLPVNSGPDIDAIPKPDLKANHWVEEFQKQGNLLVDRYGRVDATINYGGPLNAAVSVLGSEALAYLIEAPQIMGGFLQRIADLIVECYDKLMAPFNPEREGARNLFIGNCPVVMLSPRTYKETVLPADLYLRQQAGKFGLHHCGRMDLYVEDYRKLEPLEFIEVGWGSNLAAVRRAFPTAKLDLMINVYDLQKMSRETMREVINNMIHQALPVSCIRDVWVADIGPDVSDETVFDFIEAVDSAMASVENRSS